MSFSRFFASVSARNFCVSSSVGTVPTRSRYTRRRNSASVAFGAGLTPCFFHSARTSRSMTVRSGSSRDRDGDEGDYGEPAAAKHGEYSGERRSAAVDLRPGR